MKCKFVAVLICLSFTALAIAVPPQSRLAVHAGRPALDSLGLAGWAIVPNLLDKSGIKSLVLGGVSCRYQTGYTEALAGALLTQSEARLLINLRSFCNLKWLHNYGELQWFPKTNSGSTTFWSDVPVRLVGQVICKVGLEANCYFNPNNYEAGPNLVLPLSDKATLIGAYLIKNNGEWYVRFYTVLTL